MGIVAAYAVPHPPLAMPEVGRGQERAIQDTLDAYREVARRIAAHAPETVVVVSPHAPLFRDCFHLSTGDFDRGDMGRFGAWDSSMTVRYDGEMTAAIAACARKHTVPLCGSGMGGGAASPRRPPTWIAAASSSPAATCPISLRATARTATLRRAPCSTVWSPRCSMRAI